MKKGEGTYVFFPLLLHYLLSLFSFSHLHLG
jgi:hypothetical protein